MSINVCNDRSMASITSLPSGVSGSSLELISEQTASSSSAISFTSGIDSTYKEYQFHFIDVHPSNNQVTLQLEVSINSGSAYNAVATTSTYFKPLNYEDGQSANNLSYDANRDIANATSAIPIAHNIDYDTDSSCSGVLHLFDPSSTTFVKHFISTINQVFHQTPNGTSTRFVAGYVNSTSAVNAIRFSMSAGNIDSGTFKLYGVV